MAAYRRIYDSRVTCRLTAKNRDQLRNRTLGSRVWATSVVKVDRRIRWHYTTTILRLRIGAPLTRYRNCKFHNFARTISRQVDGISRYSVPPSAGPLLPLATFTFDAVHTSSIKYNRWFLQSSGLFYFILCWTCGRLRTRSCD